MGDDRGIAGVGLGFARVQVRDAPHCQPRQVAHEHVFGLGDGDRQGADGRGLIDDEQDLPMSFQLPDQLAELRFVIGQCLVEELLAGPVEGDRMVFSFADVHADEDVDAVVVLDHESSVSGSTSRPEPRHQVSASTLRTAWDESRSSPYQRSPDASQAR